MRARSILTAHDAECGVQRSPFASAKVASAKVASPSSLAPVFQFPMAAR